MKVTFDIEALAILQTLGYSYFCNKEVPPTVPGPNEGLCAYWEIIPFKTRAKAVKAYVELHRINNFNQIWSDQEYLEEMAGGMFGLHFYINIDHVLS